VVAIFVIGTILIAISIEYLRTRALTTGDPATASYADRLVKREQQCAIGDLRVDE
jgi:hypothetical protein